MAGGPRANLRVLTDLTTPAHLSPCRNGKVVGIQHQVADLALTIRPTAATQVSSAPKGLG
ncbi:Conserved hypothetical protein [Prochlorococcus marinus str. MIT 9313]|uniref:Uncharacterized protein n=1 Tax=Prochlorococcus marinus (strain MIT 9313) TaxID=74547 RepID=B9ER58_PROMM|nr:Conserved hypothetical protein [Prochlorococcus marinus str. MIT 9313]